MILYYIIFYSTTYLIVQDLGAVEFVRTIAPNLPVHGSTQMTITDANGARFTKRLGSLNKDDFQSTVSSPLSIFDLLIRFYASRCDISLSLSLSLFLSLHLSPCLSLSLSVSLSVSVCLSLSHTHTLSLSISVCLTLSLTHTLSLSIYISLSLSLTPFNSLCLSLSISLSICSCFPGVERVVVGRELSVEEIASVGKGSNVEIEAFVHGALCVSYR